MVDREPGRATRRDIDTQREAWREAIAQVEARGPALSAALEGAGRVFFVGCGSSYNVGVLAASGWTALTGIPSRAVTAGEYLRFRETIGAGGAQDVVCLLSRSGTTSETCAALQAAKRDGCRTVAVCCTADAPLAREADATLTLPSALEEAIIATRSVTSMGLAALLMASVAGRRRAEIETLRGLPDQVLAAPGGAFARGADLLAADVERVVFLGSGPSWAAALAAQLVCQEMALMDAWAYAALEFRHGPIVLARTGTLVVLFGTSAATDLEADLFTDLGNRCCRRLWVGPPHTGVPAAETLPILGALSDWARAILSLLPFHAAAWVRTVREGRDPDAGSGLARVVELDL